MKTINNSKSLRVTILLATLDLSFTAVNCAKKATTDSGAESISADSSDLSGGDMMDSDSGKAMGLQTITFPYDSSTLDSAAKAALNANAAIMKDKGSLKVQVEGHCDERGGIQYNIALGERRAASVKSFLVNKGINGDRLSVISYGKEKPVDPGHDEAAWGRNRRANFRVTEK